MASDQENARELARQFHQAYERLAPQFGHETRKESAVPWDKVPEKNRSLMTAVCGELLADLRAEDERLHQRITELERVVEAALRNITWLASKR